MILNNIKTNAQQEKGFTIVELLIVVVVIAILAAITIVSYNGITNRANASAAQSTAATLQKKIELFAADGPTGQYPVKFSDLTGGSIQNGGSVTTTSANTWYIASTSMTAQLANPDATNGKKTIGYVPCGTFSTGTASANMSTVVGAKLSWYDFTKAAGSAVTVINVGDTTGTCATS